MSKVKSPDEKKRLSYAHDRRNTYGENQKASRKLIPLQKQQGHQAERRLARQILAAAEGAVDEDIADQAQSQAMDRSRATRLDSFRKEPDTPLGDVVAQQMEKRKIRAGRKDRSRAANGLSRTP